MLNKSMSLCAATLPAAVLSFLPVPTWAQVAARTISQSRPTATPKQVEISVDWVDVPETDVSATNVGLGPNHDGRLMAALIQNGATDTKGLRLLAADGRFASVHIKTDVPTSVMVKGNLQNTVIHMDSFIEATPTVWSDGTGTITGGVQRAYLIPGVNPPAAATDFVPLDTSFDDGMPLLVNGVAGGATAAQKHYVFMTIKTVPVQTASRK